MPSIPSLNAPFHYAFPLVKNPRNPEFYPSHSRTGNKAGRWIHSGEVSIASRPPTQAGPRKAVFHSERSLPPIFCFPGSALGQPCIGSGISVPWEILRNAHSQASRTSGN